jgi:hypothetical protein
MNWKRKLTSRKMWSAVIGVVISVMVLFGADDEKQERIVAVISSSAVLISYIVGEGMVDAKNKDE